MTTLVELELECGEVTIAFWKHWLIRGDAERAKFKRLKGIENPVKNWLLNNKNIVQIKILSRNKQYIQIQIVLIWWRII